MDPVSIFIVIIMFLIVLFVPYDNYLEALAQRLALFLRKQNSSINFPTTEEGEASTKRHSLQIIVWKNNVPKIDRIPITILSEEEGKKIIVTIAQEKANEHKLEVSTTLYQGERYVSSRRALPATS